MAIRVAMEVQRKYQGSALQGLTEVPWGSHGRASPVDPLCSHWLSIGLSWRSRGITMGLKEFHGVSMIFPWDVQGISMEFP